MPSTMTGSSFTTPRDDARSPQRVPLPWDVGLCVLAAPEIVVGTVIVAGVVVVGFVIKEALDAYALDMGPIPRKRGPRLKQRPPRRNPRRKKGPSRSQKDRISHPREPPETSERDRSRCEPVPVPYHLGGNKLHDKCADRIPNNSFPGGDVFVNGKNFDALQLATRALWEVKTDDIDEYNPFILQVEINKQIEEARRERALAAACGFNFRIGVRSEAHKTALEDAAAEFKGLIEIMGWC